MKKVLVVSHAMEIGGAERALLGLLNSFDFNQYQVDLFLCRQEGELFHLIPNEVNLLPINQASCLAVPMKQLLINKSFKMLFGRLKGKLLAKKKVKELNLKKDNQVPLTNSHKYTVNYIDDINPNTTYNLAISFLTPHYICMNKCNALKKIAWIHTDYSTIDIDVNAEIDMWNKYDKIVSISDKCTQAFLDKMPVLKDKIIRIDNIITKEMIISQADDFESIEMKRTNDEIIFCSVGRFSVAKNFDNVPNICKRILDKRLNIKWYLIGYGGDEQLIKDKIKEEGMEEHVIILGKKDNPYPYIKACDFYIQPSRYEGKAVTVREAQILEKPVIITRYATSSSQLDEGIDGVIVPMDNEGCAQGIVDFINNKELQNKIISYLKEKDYSNSSEIEKIYELID